MNQKGEKYFFETFLIALVIVLLPNKALGYVVPFICLIWYMLRSKSGIVFKRVILGIVAYALIVVFYALLYWYEGIDFLVSNALVSFVSYGSFVFIILVDNRAAPADFKYQKYARVLSWVVLIQGIIGTFQFLVVQYTGRYSMLAGDAVQGTIGLFAFMQKDAGFGNQMFAINMVFFLVFLAPYVLLQRKGIASFFVGLASLMLAGVLHVFIGLIFSMLLTLFFFRKNLLLSNIGKLISAFLLAILLILPLGIIFPGIFRTVSIYATLYQNQNSPKLAIVKRTAWDMPEKYPFASLVGLGPGHYLSRAGLMSSGKYFDRDIPIFSNEISQPMKEFAVSIWQGYATNTNRYGNSTMHRPFFSLLSLYAEFGLLFFFGLLWYLAHLLAKMRRSYLVYRELGQHQMALLAFNTGLLFIFMLSISFFDNYLETTQAIFPGLLLTQRLYQVLKFNSRNILPDKVEHRQPQFSQG